MRMQSPPVNSLSLDFLTEFCIVLEKLEMDKNCRGLIISSVKYNLIITLIRARDLSCPLLCVLNQDVEGVEEVESNLTARFCNIENIIYYMLLYCETLTILCLCCVLLSIRASQRCFQLALTSWRCLGGVQSSVESFGKLFRRCGLGSTAPT